MDRCRLQLIKKAARTIKAHLWGIINSIDESLNARIQKIKAMACGFRN